MKRLTKSDKIRIAEMLAYLKEEWDDASSLRKAIRITRPDAITEDNEILLSRKQIDQIERMSRYY